MTKRKARMAETRLPTRVIQNNVALLEYFKTDVFKGDHPGIDRMVGEMRGELKRRRKRQDPKDKV